MTFYLLKHRETGVYYPAGPWDTMTHACLAQVAMPIGEAWHWDAVPVTRADAMRHANLHNLPRVPDANQEA